MAAPTPEQVLEAVRAACARVLEVEPAAVTPDLALVEDLGADSLAVVGIVELVERSLDLAYPDEELDGMRRVGDLVDRALALAGARAPA